MIVRHVSQVGLALAALASALLLAACPPLDQSLVGPEVAPVRIVESTEVGPTDGFEVTGHALDGDVLQIEVRYSGGCETHEFVGLVGSAIAESLPVQMWGRIAHDDRDDPCDAIVGGTLWFDLSPIRELHQRTYGAGPATVILHLAPIAEPLRYSF